jgi:hypothetical protein
MPHRLLFVYNADGGLLPGLKDMFHKILSPGTYPCSLCAVTYGATAMRPEWKEVCAKPARAGRVPAPRRVCARLPAVGRASAAGAFTEAATGELTPFIEAPEMDAADLNQLMALVRARLA